MSRVVLAVDDEPLVLDITAEMLEDLGCEVVTAPNAKEALNVPCYVGSSSAIGYGWTAGAGAELLVNDSVSFKVEYQFVDLGTQTLTSTALPSAQMRAPSDQATTTVAISCEDNRSDC
jgi:opacity protein-like surface antigen